MGIKPIKIILVYILIMAVVVLLSGCRIVIETPIPIPTSIPEATIPPIPSKPITEPLYPTSSENFNKIPSISGEIAEKRIIELGAGDDLNALKGWYRSVGISDTNMLPVLYEEDGKVNWNLAARSEAGNFLKFTITSGAEKGQVVRAMGMVAYLYSKPTFKLSELRTPVELAGSTQAIVWDKSGWNVLGTFRDGQMTGWYDADTNVWTVENIMPSATPTETESLQEPIVLLNEQIEYAGLQFDFSFTILPTDKYVTDKFEERGVVGFTINEEKPKARELIAKTIVRSFVETYNFQNSANVSLDTFVANPEKYPIVIVMRDADNQLAGRTLTFDQVKTVEARFVNGMHGELYMNMARYSSVGSGYAFEDGRLVLYGSISRVFESVDEFFSGGADKLTEVFPYVVGYDAGDRLLKIALGLMPYTSYIILEHGNQQKLNNDNVFTWYEKTIVRDRSSYPTSLDDVDGYLIWWKYNESFVAVVKTGQ